MVSRALSRVQAQHLLVPLDGSHLAESALPAAAYLAESLEATVVLIHVIERDAPEQIHGDRHLTQPEEASAYLDRIAANRFPADVQVQSHVHTTEANNVAQTIVDHVEEFASDLVVMCTHGRGGLRHRLFGSIAQQVAALGRSPVLLVHPLTDADRADFACRRILVPLDGKPEHEQGLPVAAGLADACSADLHLLMVIPTLRTLAGEQAATGILLPSATSALLDLAKQDARDYLADQVNRFADAGLEVSADVRRGDPAAAIVGTARRLDADVIVLGTHGKSGLDAFWAGSVAPKVSSRSHRPVLLVPAQSVEA